MGYCGGCARTGPPVTHSPGRIREGKGGFSVDYDSFLLFPTGFHQQGASVIGDEQATAARVMGTLSADTIGSPTGQRLTHGSKSSPSNRQRNLESPYLVTGCHPEPIRLGAQPRDLCPHSPCLSTTRARSDCDARKLRGCKSWIEVAQDISVDGSKAVLSDAAFSKERQAIESALNG